MPAADVRCGAATPQETSPWPGKPSRSRAGRADARRAPDYLQKILTARVYDVATSSPGAAPVGTVDNRVLLKREDRAARVQLQAARGLQQDGAARRQSSCSAA